MRPVGRTPTAFTDKDLKMIEEYLNSDASLDQMANKYNMPKSTIRYKIRKYQRKLVDGAMTGNKS